MSQRSEWNDLVHLVATRRDREAFARLFDHFVPRLEGYLLRTGLDSGTAEEVSQDVMVTLWHKAALFDPTKSSLTTWLYRVARNRRIDIARRDRLDFLDPNEPALTQIPEENGFDAALDGQRREDAVRNLMADLPPEQRDLVDLAFYTGLSHSEIAERTGLPLGTVKSRLRLAFSRLRRGLEARGISEAE